MSFPTGAIPLAVLPVDSRVRSAKHGDSSRMSAGIGAGSGSGSRRHIPALDGLRGLAILGILLFHAGHLPGGWLGVDLFFVLSGFLITHLLLNEFETSNAISLARFWERRARRLFPALLVLLLGVALYAVVFAAAEEWAGIRRDAFSTLFYIANWSAIYQGYDYWDLFTAASPLEHCWSLAIEEQFYLLWPPMVLAALRIFGRSHRSRLGILSLSLAVVSAGWMALLFEPGGPTARVYFGTDTRCFALLLGATLAAAVQTRFDDPLSSSSRAGMDGLGLLALAFQAWAWFSLEGDDPLVYRGVLFLLAVASTATIASIILAPRGLVARLFEWAPLRGLGIISYGAYLWHWPVYLVVSSHRTGLDGVSLTCLRILVTLAFCLASYFLLERHVREGWLKGRVAFGAGVAATLVVGLALLAATPPQPNAAVPVRSESDLPVAALMVGDSVTLNLIVPFREEGERRGQPALVMGQMGCTQLRSQRMLLPNDSIFAIPDCRAYHQRWRAWAAANRPRRVLLLDGWPGGGRKEIGGVWRSTCDEEYAAAYQRDLENTIVFLRRNKIEAVVLTIPEPFVPDLEGPFVFLMNRPTDEIEVMLRESTECQNRVRIRAASEQNVPILDMASWICPQAGCLREVEGIVLRFDGIHFSEDGAIVASNWLHEQLERLPDREERK